MNSTLGTPSLARRGSGQAGLDWSIVSPMTPGKVVPGLYSLSAMCFSYLVTDVLRDEDQSVLLDHSSPLLINPIVRSLFRCYRREADGSLLSAYSLQNENTPIKCTVFVDIDSQKEAELIHLPRVGNNGIASAQSDW